MKWLHIRRSATEIDRIPLSDGINNYLGRISGWESYNITRDSTNNDVVKFNAWGSQICYFGCGICLFKDERLYVCARFKPTESRAMVIWCLSPGMGNDFGMGYYMNASMEVYWRNISGAETKVGTASKNSWFEHQQTITVDGNCSNAFHFTYGASRGGKSSGVSGYYYFLGEMDLAKTGIGFLRAPLR